MVIVQSRKRGSSPAGVDPRERGEAAGRRRYGPAIGGDERDAERREHPRPGVVGAAATQPDHEAAHTVVQQRANQFTDARGRSVTDRRGHPGGIGDADDLRDFDDGRGAVVRVEHAECRGALSAARTGDDPRAACPALREHGIERALAAVGHRAGANLRAGPHAAQASRDGGADGCGVERTLERIRGEHNNRRGKRWHGEGFLMTGARAIVTVRARVGEAGAA